MKKIYFLLFALVTLSVAAQNITTNGGFENFTGTTPDDWTTIDSGISTEEETTIVNEGSKSLKVTVNTASQSSTDFRQNVTVVSGITYTVSVDIYQVGGDNDARARLYVDGFENYSSPGTVDAWQTVTTTYIATADETIEVGLRFYDITPFDGSTVIYVDNFQVIDPTLTVDQNNVAEFSIYPNPATNGFVNIKTSNNQPTQVAVFDVLGKQVINTTLSTERLNVSSLKAGIYVVRLAQGNNTITKKLVIK